MNEKYSSWAKWFIALKTNDNGPLYRSRHGTETGTVSRNIFSPRDRVPDFSDPGTVPISWVLEFRAQKSRKFWIWVPVPVLDFLDRDRGILGPMSRIPIPDYINPQAPDFNRSHVRYAFLYDFVKEIRALDPYFSAHLANNTVTA